VELMKNIAKIKETPIIEYDKNGNIIHYKDSTVEYWKQYDENGKMIHCKHSSGFECWDSNNTDKVRISAKNNQIKI